MESEAQVFYISLASIGVGLIIACMRYGYKSKCSEVDICCIHIKRNVVEEIKYDIEHPIEEEEQVKEKV